jgi:hypothetical protein
MYLRDALFEYRLPQASLSDFLLVFYQFLQAHAELAPSVR